MCGIAMALGTPHADTVAAAMSRSLAHRGPDAAGACPLVRADGRAVGALAHRRLSILDLTAAAHQPMRSANGRFTVAFNGEIYNFRALRSELEHAGARFTSDGDTAVLLEGWAHFGASVVHRLDGMFAFVIWDARDGVAYLARDRYGIKPLYVTHAGGGVLAASEVRALLASGLVARRIDPRALAGYLAFGSVPEPETIVAGVRMVPAGSVIRLASALPAWHETEALRVPLVDDPDVRIGSRDAARALVRRALEESVDRHLVSDVPVAVFLSGGIDSSATAALAAQRAGTAIDGFTVTFREGRYDESTAARAVARRHGIRRHEIPLGADALLERLPAAFAAMDQPTLDGINTHLVSAAVRAHGLKVVLSGLGGDELFAGYPSFGRALSLARYARIPAGARRAAAHLAGRVGGLRGAKAAIALRSEAPAIAAYLASRTVFPDAMVTALCAARPSPIEPVAATGTLLQQVSSLELSGYMRNTLLRDTDVFSMAHALEVRVPFVDRAVVHAAFRAADEHKLGGDRPKPLLVDAVRDLLPAEVWDRPKQGFVLPFADWLRGPLASDVRAALADRHALRRLGLVPAVVQTIIAAFERGRGGMTWSRPWALYALVRWAQATGIEGVAETPGHEPALVEALAP